MKALLLFVIVLLLVSLCLAGGGGGQNCEAEPCKCDGSCRRSSISTTVEKVPTEEENEQRSPVLKLRGMESIADTTGSQAVAGRRPNNGLFSWITILLGRFIRITITEEVVPETGGGELSNGKCYTSCEYFKDLRTPFMFLFPNPGQICTACTHPLFVYAKPAGRGCYNFRTELNLLSTSQLRDVRRLCETRHNPSTKQGGGCLCHPLSPMNPNTMTLFNKIRVIERIN